MLCDIFAAPDAKSVKAMDAVLHPKTKDDGQFDDRIDKLAAPLSKLVPLPAASVEKLQHTLTAANMTVLPIFAVKMKLNNAADRLLRQAETSGHTNLSLLIDELKAETDLPFTVSWAGTDYLDGSGEVQLNHDIKLLVSISCRA